MESALNEAVTNTDYEKQNLALMRLFPLTRPTPVLESGTQTSYKQICLGCNINLSDDHILQPVNLAAVNRHQIEATGRQGLQIF